jgi:Na+/melibiose symporter-like transporter
MIRRERFRLLFGVVVVVAGFFKLATGKGFAWSGVAAIVIGVVILLACWLTTRQREETKS